MIKDFTHESFLCFVEMIQFKMFVIDTLMASNPHFDEDIRHQHRFFKHCPQSSIVFRPDVPIEALRRHQERTVVNRPAVKSYAEKSADDEVNKLDQEGAVLEVIEEEQPVHER